MGAIHEELYSRVKALFDQDLDATRGLNKSGSAAYCRGGMWRVGDPKKTKNYPHIDVRINVDEDLNSADGTCCLCTVELKMVAARDQKYEGNSGDVALNTVAQRVREVFNDAPVEKGTGSNLYRISSFKRTGGGLGGETDKELTLFDRYQVLVTSRETQVFHVYNGASKTFYRGGFSREGRRFVCLDIGDIEAPNNEVPHVGWSDHLQIVQSVTRTRVFNKYDAEYMVTYKPLDFSFDRQQRRVRVKTGYIDQVVPLWKRQAAQGNQGNIVSYIPQYINFRRTTFSRTEQVTKDVGKSVGTDILLDIQNQIAADTNTIRVIDGKKYLFIGADVEYNTNSGLALVTARFWTTGPVKAVPANSAQGVIYDVALPALDYLEDYIVTPPVALPSGGTSIPSIGKKNVDDLYTTGVFAWLA